MANLSHIARPYALAAFEFAQDKNDLPAWQTYLNMAASIINNPASKSLLENPMLANTFINPLLNDMLDPFQDKNRQNFLSLLAANHRLYLFPYIAEVFNTLIAALEQTSHIKLVTAIDTNEQFQQTLSKALTHRFQSKITLECKVDPSIIAGAILYIGDRVIDGSVRGKLSRLLEFSLR